MNGSFGGLSETQPTLHNPLEKNEIATPPDFLIRFACRFTPFIRHRHTGQVIGMWFGQLTMKLAKTDVIGQLLLQKFFH